MTVTPAPLPLVPHWVDGEPRDGVVGTRPATSSTPPPAGSRKHVAFASPADVDAAVAAAGAAFPAWRATSLAERTQHAVPVP